MQDGEGMWLEAAAGLQSELDADVRTEAFEVFVAEAARVRIEDRRGPARLVVRSGVVLTGDLADAGQDALAGLLELLLDSGRRLLVPIDALVTMTGAPVRLQVDEPAGIRPTLASRLREAWQLGEQVRVLLSDGRWLSGPIVLVGSDHVELGAGLQSAIIPFGAVDAWQLP
jgi:3',5'-cyclic AMP phosphodiesterase CpdA